MDFETELRRITEAHCLNSNIPIRRRFTDAELVDATARVRDAIERQQPLELDDDPDYPRQQAEARGSQTNHDGGKS